MSESQGAAAAPDDAARQQLDDDDHDLLTFGEVGERLRVEVAAAAARLAELRSSADQSELAAAAARLIALRTAAQRNAVSPINDANFERFFGYPGKARSAVPRPPEG
jgi:hypothetical protein